MPMQYQSMQMQPMQHMQLKNPYYYNNMQMPMGAYNNYYNGGMYGNMGNNMNNAMNNGLNSGMNNGMINTMNNGMNMGMNDPYKVGGYYDPRMQA